MTYRDLVDHLCDALAGSWDCHGTLAYTRIFCEEHGIDFEAIRAELAGHGIVADCEALLHLITLDLHAELPGVP